MHICISRTHLIKKQAQFSNTHVRFVYPTACACNSFYKMRAGNGNERRVQMTKTRRHFIKSKQKGRRKTDIAVSLPVAPPTLPVSFLLQERLECKWHLWCLPFYLRIRIIGVHDPYSSRNFELECRRNLDNSAFRIQYGCPPLSTFTESCAPRRLSATC